MAITFANVLSSQSTVGASSYTTASFTPAANTLYLATFVSRTGITADPTQPTCTGAGLTWIAQQSIVFDTASSSRRRVTVFRSMGTGSAGGLTFDEAGQAQTNGIWIIDSATGIDTSGTNGSGAIVQSAATKDETSVISSYTVTLAAFGSASNAAFGAFGFGDPGTTMSFTAGSGFTLLAGLDTAIQGAHAASEYQATSNTAVALTFTAGSEVGGIAMEIKAAVAAATTYNSTALMMGI